MNDEVLDKVIDEVLGWADEDELAATMPDDFRSKIRAAVREVIAMHPSPLELAEKALVAAVVAEELAYQDLHAYNGALAGLYELRAKRNAAATAATVAVRAYIAALAGAK